MISFFQKSPEQQTQEELEQTFEYFKEYSKEIDKLQGNSNAEISPNVVLNTLLLKYSESSEILHKNINICNSLSKAMSTNPISELSWLNILEEYLQKNNFNKGRFYGLMVTFFYYYADLLPVDFNDYPKIKENFVAVNQNITQQIEFVFVNAIINKASDPYDDEFYNNIYLSNIKILNEQQEERLIDEITIRLRTPFWGKNVDHISPSQKNLLREDIINYCMVILGKLELEVSQKNKGYLIQNREKAITENKYKSLRDIARSMLPIANINSLVISTEMKKLQTLLSDTIAPTTQARIDAFSNLGKLKNTSEEEQVEIIKVSIHAITDSGNDIQSAAKNTLCKMQISDKNLEDLIDRLLITTEKAPHPYMKEDAIYILGNLKYSEIPKEVIMILLKSIDYNKDYRIINASIKSLTTLTPHLDSQNQLDIIGVIMTLLESTDSTTDYSVINASLEALKTLIPYLDLHSQLDITERVVNWLLKNIDNLHPTTKVSAAEFLGRLSFSKVSQNIQTNTTAILNKLISDLNLIVQKETLICLGKLNLNISLLLEKTTIKNFDSTRQSALLALSYVTDVKTDHHAIIETLLERTSDTDKDIQKTASEVLIGFAKKQSMITIAALIIKLEQIVLQYNSKLELKINFKAIVDELKSFMNKISFENKVEQWKQLGNSEDKQYSQQSIIGPSIDDSSSESDSDFGNDGEISLKTFKS